MSAPADPRRFWAGLAGDARLRFGVRPDDRGLRGLEPVYLATPYTLRAMRAGGGFDVTAAEGAMRDALDVLSALNLAGVAAFAPIVQSHAVALHGWELIGEAGRAEAGRLALDGEFWARLNRPFLNMCRGIYVPAVPGWEASAGIMAEVEAMLARNRPVLLEAPAFAIEGAAGGGR